MIIAQELNLRRGQASGRNIGGFGCGLEAPRAKPAILRCYCSCRLAGLRCQGQQRLAQHLAKMPPLHRDIAIVPVLVHQVWTLAEVGRVTAHLNKTRKGEPFGGEGSNHFKEYTALPSFGGKAMETRDAGVILLAMPSDPPQPSGCSAAPALARLC
ncbi:hypothetical protein VTG60DRAFT_5485 [Thermothelomyces hinnuleus]